MGWCMDSRLFATDTVSADVFHPLSFEVVSQPGYYRCEAYRWLAERGGLEGQYEMQAVLGEATQRVDEITKNIRSDWMRRQAQQVAH